MTIIEVIDFLNEIAKNQKNINSFGEGDIYEFFNGNPSVKYSTFFITQNQHKSSEEIDNYSLTLFYVDRLTDNGDNKLQIQSTGKEVLQNIIRIFKYSVDAESEDIVFQPFTQRFIDNCAGVYAQITLQIFKGNTCPEDDGYSYNPSIRIINQTKDLKVTNNGEYVIEPDKGYDGLDRVNISVDVPLPVFTTETKSVEYTKNGKYKIEKSENVDGITEATVDVALPFEEKIIDINEDGQTVVVPSSNVEGITRVTINTDTQSKIDPVKKETYTSNGTYQVRPEAGQYGIAGADIDVAIPFEEKTIQVNENGQTVVVPSENAEGITKVIINTDISSKIDPIKSETYTENGTYEITPSEGQYGIEGATVSVDVQPKLQSKSVVENGVVVPDEGFYGLSDVDVNVPIPVFSTEEKTVDIIKNGQTIIEKSNEVDGMTKVIANVNVHSKEPVTEPLKVIKNGIYEPSVGIDGFNKVDVNVPEKVLGSLHPIVKENGRYEWTPQSPTDGWYYVELNVNVPIPEIEENKVIQINSNGKTTINPSIGFDALKQAEIEVNVPTGTTCNLGTLTATENKVYRPVDLDGWNTVEVKVPEKKIQQSKTKEITQNGVQMVMPDTGYDGIKNVVLDVNVPTGGGGNLDLTGTGWETEPSFTVNVARIDTLEQDLDYTRTKFSEFNPNWTNLYRNYKDDTNLIYAPKIDCSKVTEMGSCFFGCTNLFSIPKLDTGKVISLRNCFYNCSNLTSIPMLNTSSVTDMDACFYNCSNLTSIPMLNTSSVTDMGYCFNGCTNLTYIPMLNTNSVTDMGYCFCNCSNLAYIPMLNTSSVTNMDSCFNNCTSLTSIPMLNTNSVTDMSSCFFGCTNLTSIPMLNTSKVTTMENCFYNCKGLTNLGGFTGLKVSIKLTYYVESYPLTKQSLLNVINNLGQADPAYSGGKPVLTIGQTNLNKLTESEIARGIAKGWQIVA